MHHVLISKTETSEEENPETLSNPEAESVFLLFSLGRKELATMVLWVFGYGSLIWNPGFDFDQKILGYIKDYRRVFDLACIDHRGTPEHPARTLTVESKKGALCWGIAYCVRGGLEKERMAMEYLRMRECEYDLETYVDFYTDQDQEEDATGTPVVTRTLMFCSTPCKVSNKYYLGTAPLGEMATQIATAIGPCGNNREYLFNLEKALFRIGHEEDSITELANEVRKVMIRFKEKKMIGAHLALNSHLSPVPHILNTSETIVTTDSV